MNKQSRILNLIKKVIIIIALYISVYFITLIMAGEKPDDLSVLGSISLTIVVIYIWNNAIKNYE